MILSSPSSTPSRIGMIENYRRSRGAVESSKLPRSSYTSSRFLTYVDVSVLTYSFSSGNTCNRSSVPRSHSSQQSPLFRQDGVATADYSLRNRLARRRLLCLKYRLSWLLTIPLEFCHNLSLYFLQFFRCMLLLLF